MDPRLVVLAGLPEIELIHLNLKNGESFVLGRDVECNLPIRNTAVSRHHCRITRTEDDYRLEDLDSHNGTFVNDLPVKSHLLKHGDRISLGNSYLMFFTVEDDNSPEMQVAFDEGSLVTNSTIRLFPYNEVTAFSPDLKTLVRFGKVLNEFKEPKALQRSFLEIILELIPASHGAILLGDEELNEYQSVYVSSSRYIPETEPMRVSHTICRRVLTEQAALLSNDLTDSQLSATESLIDSCITSLLCVPLRIGESKGLIYLDSGDRSVRFTENHLEQLTALSFLISALLAKSESIESLRWENELLKADLGLETDIIGESRAMREIFHLISKVAAVNTTVLINGESGTGKELVAKAIRQNSSRREKPYAAINCAVLGENLLESELFGYEKGAFTGAVAQKKGKLELINGGTLFLDEVGELTLPVQAKLLRFLQEHEFERVGGSKPIKVNVRVIAATNRDLEEEIKKGTFRRDLFFRLNVVKIKMPPLRERRSDIPLLAQYFIKKYNEKCNRKVIGLSERARQAMINYEWQGNVRELENVIERAIVLGSTDTIQPEDLPEEIVGSAPPEQVETADFHQQIKEAKRRVILDALEKSGGNYTEAARRLGINRTNLHRLIRNLGMKV
ncbi:MAG: sigma 54-interacting transcriptional regulator [Acidobacteriota bacterium]|nr:sigma 54-interacting transcriptional regulator [Acidobacteriota bacterium]